MRRKYIGLSFVAATLVLGLLYALTPLSVSEIFEEGGLISISYLDKCTLPSKDSSKNSFVVCGDYDLGNRIVILISSDINPEYLPKADILSYNGPFNASLRTMMICPHSTKQLMKELWKLEFPLQLC